MKRRKRLSALTRPANIAPFKLATFVIDQVYNAILPKNRISHFRFSSAVFDHCGVQ